MIIGVIDIGSNSTRLMMSDTVNTLSKDVVTTRLGEGLAVSGVMSDYRMNMTADAVKEYVERAKKQGAEKVFVFATETVRSAKNRKEFTDLVYNKCGIVVDVIDGKTEATLGFNGAYHGVLPVAVVDIGGASTEITVGDASGIMYSVSRPIGCVRMRDKCGEDDRLLDDYIGSILEEYGDIPSVDKAIFVAGTASTVATMIKKIDVYDVKAVDNLYINSDELEELITLLKNTPLDKRNNIIGLPDGRRDIMYGGMLLIRNILKRLNLQGFFFSDRDNLEGYVKYLVSHGKL